MDSPPEGAGAASPRAALADELILCARVLGETLAGTHLDTALARSPAAGAGSDRAIRDMAYAAVRTLGLLQFLASRLNSRKPAPLLGFLQLAALAQLLDGRRAAPIVIDQAVAAAARLPDGLGNRFSAGFMNATLRRFARERTALLALAAGDEQATFNHPSWWVAAVRRARPDDWRAILALSLTHAPLTLRVNRRTIDAGDPVAAISQKLSAAHLTHRRVGVHALVLDRAVNVQHIPGFAEGEVTVQDAGAQLAAPLLRPGAGDRILDACAAPGGKTTHLLQLADCRVLALDHDPRRIGRIVQNLARERLPQHPEWPPPSWGAVVQTADAARPESWWDGECFDRILLDAPCSASGIVRRHPDVLWHRRRRDIATLAARQGRLLEALWPLLRPGGTLLYVTCSIFPDEGEAVIAAFCSRQADSVRESPSAAWSDGQPVLSQLMPTSTDDREHDGFFYALLSKRP